MAKKALIEKWRRTPKFQVRGYSQQTISTARALLPELDNTHMQQQKAAIDQAQTKSINDMRKTLGTAPDGKSDEEVANVYSALSAKDGGQSQPI